MQSSVLYQKCSRLPIYNQVIRVLSVSSNTNTSKNLKPWTEIPGPKSYPIVGSLFNFLPGGELYNFGIDQMPMLHSKYGPIVKIDKMLGKKPYIFVFDAESAAQIYRGENQMPIRLGLDLLSHYRRNIKNTPPGSPLGLLGINGESWQQFRSTVNPVLLQPNTIKLYTSVIDEIALEMIERLKNLRNESGMISNFNKEMHLWALESIGEVALGCRIKCFANNLDENSLAHQFIEVVQGFFKAAYDVDMIKPLLWKYYPTKEYLEYYKKLETLALHFIDQAIKEIQTNPKPEDQKGVLEKLLEINKEVAVLMATDMLLAGIDTAAYSVIGAIYLLAANPDKQSKLRAELKKNHEKRPYLKACVKEAIRMMPVTSGSARETTKEHSIFGYKIPKGLNVILAHMDMSRMDKYFVKPNEYIPERWIVDKDDPLHSKNAYLFAYGPFGFGTRSCVGRRIAELEIETFIGRVIENFEIEWFGPPPKVVTSVVNQVLGPYNFIFKDVK